ncbi:MAG TPA: ATP-binding protein [Thermoanaerobaculia bacterium]|nr:ATP-binding protein [Thermoanaerobaculia bacterium]
MSGAYRLRAAGFPGLRITVLLLAVLLTVNAVAVWGILSARAGAHRAARDELALQTTAHARSLEAVLATLRGDFIFLSQSPPLLQYPAALQGEDETQRRWARLDVDSTLLLFAEAHPQVERLVVRGDLGEALAVVGRRGGVPVLLPPASFAERATGSGRRLLAGRWPLGTPTPLAAAPGTLEAWISPDALLAIAAPGFGERLRLETRRTPAAGRGGGGGLEARVAVREPRWTPPIAWTLVRSEPGSELVQSVESLAGRYRTTVLLNLAVMTLTLALGLLAFRQVRRAARLEAENEQQARVRELERRLMHSERLASVGRLAAGMAHEINNPLAGMSNYLSLLEEDLRDGRTAEAPALVARVREGLARAAGIVRQVLAFSDPGHAPKAPLDLREVLAETVEFVRGNPAFRGVAVRLDGDAGELPVLGNRITLGQLFLNLILNACQSQPDGGEVEVLAERGEEGLTVIVADRGPGLAPAVLNHLFEPFTSTRGSSGLGLSVCHGIVADHGGAIEGANRHDGGALFAVRLPLAAAMTAEPAPAVFPRAASGGRR